MNQNDKKNLRNVGLRLMGFSLPLVFGFIFLISLLPFLEVIICFPLSFICGFIILILSNTMDHKYLSFIKFLLVISSCDIFGMVGIISVPLVGFFYIFEPFGRSNFGEGSYLGYFIIDLYLGIAGGIIYYIFMTIYLIKARRLCQELLNRSIPRTSEELLQV
jgi:hypothetical protein